jgi:hypothetical protein
MLCCDMRYEFHGTGLTQALASIHTYPTIHHLHANHDKVNLWLFPIIRTRSWWDKGGYHGLYLVPSGE